MSRGGEESPVEAESRGEPVLPQATARRMLLALALGSAGGYLAYLANLPLAWMIGAMLATTVASVAGLPVAVDMRLRAVMVMVLGVLLGSAFSPAIVERLADWALSLSVLALYTAAAGGLGTYYFRRACGYDRVTAYFSAMPGGLSEMILVGSAMGGDGRIISLTHASRILLVVLALPFAFQLVGGYDPGERPPVGPAMVDIGGLDIAVLIACGIVGFYAAKALKVPAAALVGPMVISAAVHLAGLTAAKPPAEIVAVAQVIVGSAIGARFAGTALSVIKAAILAAAGGTVVLLAATLAFAAALSGITDLDATALILAFSPGGLAEMSLIALALSMDAAFVATHHIVRIFLIVVFAPLAFRFFRRREPGR